MSFDRLIRFEDESGKVRFGEPQIDNAEELLPLLKSGKLLAQPFTGSSFFDLSLEDGNPVRVKGLLAVLRPSDVPIIKCIGLNYIAHSK